MALPIKVKSLEEVAEGVREHYAKQSDGTFLLDGVEDVSGLKNALETERGSVSDLQKKLKALQGQFSDIDVDEYKAMKADLEKSKTKKMIDEGKVEELLQERTQKMKTEMQKAIDELTARNTTLDQQLSSVVIDSQLMTEGVNLGAFETAIEDIKLRGRNVFKLNEEGKALPYKDGKVVYGKDGTTPQSIGEWLNDLQKTSPHLFKSSSGGGTPPGGGANGSGNGQFTITRTAAADNRQYRALKEQAEKAGQTVQVVDG